MRDSFEQAVRRTLPPARSIPLDEVLNKKKRMPVAVTRRGVVFGLIVLLLCLTAAGVAWTLTAGDLRRAWEKEKGPMETWTLEDKAAFAAEAQNVEPVWENAPYRAAREGEISKEAAKAIAVTALIEQYGLTAETLSGFRYQEELTYLDADFPEEGCFYQFTWINNTDTAAHPGGDVYTVRIDPGTGEILTVQSMDDMVG